DTRAQLGVEESVEAVRADIPAARGVLRRAVDKHSRSDEAVEDPVADVEAEDGLGHVDVGVTDASGQCATVEDGEVRQVESGYELRASGIRPALVHAVDRQAVEVPLDGDRTG